jgi:hypothetical protein
MSNQLNLPTMQQTSVPEVILRAVEQSLRTLNAAKAEYVIRLPNGMVYERGDLKLATESTEKKRTRAPSKMPRGYIAKAIQPIINPMQAGDVAEFRCDAAMVAAGVELRHLQSSVSSHASTIFGVGNHKVYTNKKTQCVELLRTA